MRIDEILSQPFSGYSNESYQFLKALKSKHNNNKEWFDKHRDIYETFLKREVRELVDTLAPKLISIDSTFVLNHKSILRINRDIRFKEDKTPYKTFSAVSFGLRVLKHKDIPQIYFHFSPDEFLIAAGQYSTEPSVMKRIRQKIVTSPDSFLKIIHSPAFQKEYKKIQGEKLLRLPVIFSEYANTPIETYLKYKNMYVYKEYEPKVAMKPELVELILYHTRLMYDFLKFLSN
ncbi:MAG: DUF2461 domain-containing protein [Ignavibacteria bacterium]